MHGEPQFWVLLLTLLGMVLLCVKPLGIYMANVLDGAPGLATRLGGPIEAWIYRRCGIRRDEDMAWPQYAIALLLFNLLGALLVYGLQRLQFYLPFNPQHLTAVRPDTAFNTAVSFVTNTNWQAYSGESTMGYLAQMAGLAVQNFLSAATGIAVAIVLVRGFVRQSARAIGNFWVDVTRATLYVLLPIAAVLAVALVATGVIQNFDDYKDASTLEAVTYQQPKVDPAGNPVKDSRAMRSWNPSRRMCSPCRWVRSPPRKRSRNWAPTVAVS